MHEKAIDVGPINGLAIPIPKHTLAARVPGGHNTYRFFDLQRILRYRKLSIAALFAASGIES